MSTVINVRSDSEPSSQPKGRCLWLRSRGDLLKTASGDLVRGLYKVRAEAPIDLVWAFHAITKAGYTYMPHTSIGGDITFSTKCSLWKLRLLWNTLNKDLHVMIETLNFANEYTGDRYFTKYWDAKTSEKKEDLAYYNSDNSDSEEEDEEFACKFCECDPNQEDHLEDCEALQPVKEYVN